MTSRIDEIIRAAHASNPGRRFAKHKKMTTRYRKPAHLQALESEGYSLHSYVTAREFFSRHGLMIGYSQIRRSWFIQRIGGAAGTCCVATCWLGLIAFIEALDAPSAILKQFGDMSA